MQTFLNPYYQSSFRKSSNVILNIPEKITVLQKDNIKIINLD